MPTMELDIFEFGEEGKCLLAESRLLSDLIPLTQSPLLVGDVLGRDPSSCTMRECDRWNLILMRPGTHFRDRVCLSRTAGCRAVTLLRGRPLQMAEFWCLVSGIQGWCSFPGPLKVCPKLHWASGLGVSFWP